MSSSPPLHILQEVRCAKKTEAGTIAGGDLRFDGGRLKGMAGLEVTFDGIFGAFFDGYWARHTVISDLAVSFRLAGSVEITVDRIAAATGSHHRIVFAVVEGRDEEITIPVPLAEGGDTRLVLRLRLIADTSISDLAWATGTLPARVVGLNAVICTYNREDDLAATIDELLRNDSGVQRTLVVNQGEPGLAVRLGRNCHGPEAGSLTIIDQRNLGGAGGFGRGMLESISDVGCSHILLMDDDVDLDASSVKRLIAVLSYLRSDHAIGGAMLDRNDRNRLFSVGDVLHDSKPEIRNLADPGKSDITNEATCRYLSLDHRPDFNGWWFWAFPKAQLSSVGLPLPLFIRGDDVEYGYRSTLSGIRTLAWPGLAVWHEPFHTKRHPWHYFYDRRNSLFLCEMHRRLGRLRLSVCLVTGFLNHLLRYDYARAMCITLGLRAFNEGANGLARWTGADHARLAENFSSRERPAAASAESAPLPVSPWPTSLLFLFRLFKDLSERLAPANEIVAVSARHWSPLIRHRPRYVRVYYEDSNTVDDFRFEPGRTRKCAKSFFRELIWFLFRPWRPAQLRALAIPEFWSGYTS